MPASEAVVLPGSAIPRKYTLRLQPDLEEFVFSGQEVVDLDVSETITEIVMNSLDIEIQSARLESGGNVIAVREINYDKDREAVTLTLAAPAAPGPAQLNMNFTRSSCRASPAVRVPAG